MAHLRRCWCGRLYRCDVDHRDHIHLDAMAFYAAHGHCPDQVLHQDGLSYVAHLTRAMEEEFFRFVDAAIKQAHSLVQETAT